MECSGDLPLQLAGLTKESVVDGPGLRTVLFAQGCPHRCPGCHNPETWPFEGGRSATVDRVWQEIKDERLLRGVTFSGGEPFAQAAPLAALAARIKGKGWDLLVYSGFTWEQLLAKAEEEWPVADLLTLTDILIDGPFLMAERDLALPFRGSRNQRILDPRRSAAAGHPVPWELPG